MPMRRHRLQQITNTWSTLREPFILPQTQPSFHECQWEKIDIDVLGCLVCGKIHACEYGTCKDIIDTNDGLVCNVSGVVIYDKKFVETEYMDTLILIGSEQMQAQNSIFSDVEQVVSNFFGLQRKKSIRDKAFSGMVLKLIDKFESSISKKNSSLPLACSEFISHCMKIPFIFQSLSNDQSRKHSSEATEYCCKVLQILIQTGMPVRNCEIQKLAVGALYLLRCGVVFNDVVVVPRRLDIYSILPPESMLLSFFDVHPKCITDVENRLKFCLRKNIDSCFLR
jgi:hypothetical protein